MTDSQKWLWFAGIMATGWLIYLLAPILFPFLLAALLAYLGDPLADKLQSLRMSRTWAVIVVFSGFLLVLILALLLLVPQIEKQIVYLLSKLPDYIDAIQHRLIPWLAAQFGITEFQVDMNTLKQWLAENWKQAGGFAKVVLGSLSNSGLALVGFIGSLVLTPVVAFYLLRDWDHLIQRIRELVPRRMEPDVSKLAHESDLVLGAFIRGQLLVMLALGIVYSIGLWLAGLKLALLIGLLAGLVSFVPYLGFIVGVLAAGVAMVLQTNELTGLLYVFAVFGVGQLLESVILTPMLVGDRIGLHPVAVIFAVMAGGQLFGFMGVLLALPVAAVLAVVLRHIHEGYVKSPLYDNRAA